MRDLPFTVSRLAIQLLFIAVAAIAFPARITGAEPPSRPEIATPESVGLSSVELGGITSLLRDCVNEGKIAGTVTLIGRYGRIAHLDTAGFSDIESGTPMSVDALFRIASMTKGATAVATLRLHDEGTFALDDNASRFVPELQGCRVQAPATDGSNAANAAATVPLQGPITIRDLLRHTSGLRRGPAFGALFRDHAVWSEEDGLARLAEALAQNPLAAQPGAEFSYGLSSDVLGLLLERATGQPLDEILREHVFEPLKMRDTGFHARWDQAARLTSYYNYEEGRLVQKESAKESPFLNRPQCFSGGGGWPEGHAGLLSTAEDWWRLCEMIRNHGQLDGVRLLREETVEKLVTNQLGSTAAGRIPSRPGLGYGLSVGVVLDRAQAKDPGSDGQVFWAGGPYNTYFFIDGAEQMVGILLLQTGPWRHLELMDRFNEMAHRAIDDPAGGGRPLDAWAQRNTDRTTKPCYLDQPLPRDTPQVFARGVVSTDHLEHSAPAFSPDGDEVFWSIWRRPDKSEPQVIMTMRREGDAWPAPVVAPFSGTFGDGGPVVSADGRRVYFYSSRPTRDERGHNDLWFIEKREDG